MTGPATAPTGCTYSSPASERDAEVALEPGAEPGARWRARCACGWQAAGYVDPVAAWKGLDRHRDDAAAYRSLR